MGYPSLKSTEDISFWLLVPAHSVVLPKVLIGQAVNQITETPLVKSYNRHINQKYWETTALLSSKWSGLHNTQLHVLQLTSASF